MTPLLCALPLLLLAAGEDPAAGGYSVSPSLEPPPHETTVTDRRPSPPHTQDRTFAGTRFWLLDPGSFEVEVWCSDKFKRSGDTEGLLQVELEIGLAPHLQLDVYQNFSFGTPGFGTEGNQLELRFSPARSYNQLPLNPVLYLEWHPRNGAQDRAEVRVLLGGDLFGSRVLWATNLFFELNIDNFDRPYAEGNDMEAGATFAASVTLVDQVLRLGVEAKVGADQHGDPVFYPMALVGPNLLLKLPAARLKLTATLLIGLFPKDPKFQPFVILGWGF